MAVWNWICSYDHSEVRSFQTFFRWIGTAVNWTKVELLGDEVYDGKTVSHEGITSPFRPLVDSICFSMDPRGPAAFWACLFSFSKIAEFGDTLFLVLRKRPVIFLHWLVRRFLFLMMFFRYHHAVVIILSWHSGESATNDLTTSRNFKLFPVQTTTFGLRQLQTSVVERVMPYLKNALSYYGSGGLVLVVKAIWERSLHGYMSIVSHSRLVASTGIDRSLFT